jgi:cell division protein FtsQ
MNKWMLLRLPAGIMVLLAGLWFGWQEIKAQGADLMPVRYVRVEGAFQYIARESVKAVLESQIKHGFYNADLQNIQTSVRALPWAEQVQVQRIWPDAIKVRITEQRPVARWGEAGLLNDAGELFQPANIAEFDSLPVITGPQGREQNLLNVMIGLQTALQDKALVLKEFVVNERRAWSVRLANGLEIKLGRNNPLQNIQRLLRTVELLGEDLMVLIAAVDLRYPNGYAVTWREGVERSTWETLIKQKQSRA